MNKKYLVFLIIAVAMLILIGRAVNNSYKDPAVKAEAAPKSDGCVTVKGYFVCVNEEYFVKVSRLIADNDTDAIQKLIDQKAVFMLNGGDKVFIAETHLLSGAVEIRLPGSTDQFWTNIEAVKCQ